MRANKIRVNQRIYVKDFIGDPDKMAGSHFSGWTNLNGYKKEIKMYSTPPTYSSCISHSKNNCISHAEKQQSMVVESVDQATTNWEQGKGVLLHAFFNSIINKYKSEGCAQQPLDFISNIKGEDKRELEKGEDWVDPSGDLPRVCLLFEQAGIIDMECYKLLINDPLGKYGDYSKNVAFATVMHWLSKEQGMLTPENIFKIMEVELNLYLKKNIMNLYKAGLLNQKNFDRYLDALKHQQYIASQLYNTLSAKLKHYGKNECNFQKVLDDVLYENELNRMYPEIDKIFTNTYKNKEIAFQNYCRFFKIWENNRDIFQDIKTEYDCWEKEGTSQNIMKEKIDSIIKYYER